MVVNTVLVAICGRAFDPKRPDMIALENKSLAVVVNTVLVDPILVGR